MPFHATRTARSTAALAAVSVITLASVGCGSSPQAISADQSSRSALSSKAKTFAPSPDAITDVADNTPDPGQTALRQTYRPVDFAPHPNAANPATVDLPGNVVGVAYRVYEQHSPASFAPAADKAADRALQQPGTTSEALVSPHADLDSDGFITADELAALSRTWSDRSVIQDRIDAIGARYYVDDDAAGHLTAVGVEPVAVRLMHRRSFSEQQPQTGIASVPTE
ncbi:MAG: hypothetical protein AAGK09_10005 [Planctomycetota bacterium]